ncbi:MAG: chitobiase/beta-hexosaminidase C-terminal domain-containing protein, partial [Bacteroidetes bacterium]|nr:chitobiase/beta-hexosaminidase C-terminal domain-containing protein [Bacteroidota bacterium]
IAQTIFKSSDEDETYDFAAASEKTIQKLNTNYRAVYPLAEESPGIAVDFFGAAFFKSDQLKDLLEIKTQLVSLNLDKMPVTDNDLQTIGQFTNLRKLNLSFSKITGNGLPALDKLIHLKEISLTNTSIKKEDIEKLASLKELHHIFIWNSGISVADANAIRKKYPMLDLETGMRVDTMYLKINPPAILTDQAVIVDTPIQLRMKHFVPGITIHYSTDGTVPDSINSPLYTDKTFIDKPGLMKAKAFKKGWNGSDVVEYRFYKATYKADTVILLKPADSNYKAKGGRTINDFVKGSQNFGDGKWIAFRNNNMECLMVFPKTITAQNITISSLVNPGGWVFPPKDVKIFGGTSEGSLKLLYHLSPPQDTMLTSNYMIPYECKIAPTALKYIKVVAEPFGRIPKSFIPVPVKEEKKVADNKDKTAKPVVAVKKEKPKPPNYNGWFFIDEIFVN